MGLGPEGLVELYRDVARNFEMLLLIFADRDEIAVVDQNIGRHQDWISEKPGRRRQAARHLVLVGMGPFEQAFRGHRRQNPGQLCYLRDIALPEKRVPFYVE